MQDENMSSKELLAVRKQRKLEKRKAARRAVLIPYIKRMIAIALLIVLGLAWMLIDLHINRSTVDEEDTYSYIGTCVNVAKKSKRSLVHYGDNVVWIEISFADGYSSKWNVDQFSDSELETMKGSQLTLLMAKDKKGDYPVGITHENGYDYWTLEEHNAKMKEYRLGMFFLIAIPILVLYVLFLWITYPRKY